MPKFFNKYLILNLRSEVERNFFSLLFLLYLSLSIVRFNLPANLFLTFAIAIFALSLLFLVLIKMKKKEINCLIFLVLLLSSFALSSFLVGREYRIIQNLIFILMSSGIAFTLTRGLVKKWAVYIPFYGLLTFFIIHIILGHNPDEILVCSHNGVSLMLLATLIPVYILSDHQKVDLKPAFFSFLLAIWAVGRSGIGSIGMLLIGMSIIKYRQTQKYAYLFLAVMTIFICLILILFPLLHLDLYKTTKDFLLTYFSVALTDDSGLMAYDVSLGKAISEMPSERLGILFNYLENLDFYHFLFGVNVMTMYWPEAQFFGYNLHNTFINLHSQTGILGVLVILTIIYSSYFFYSVDKKIYSLLILVMMLRWSTDIGLFFESWDFIPYFFIFTFLERSNLFSIFIRKIIEIRAKL